MKIRLFFTFALCLASCHVPTSTPRQETNLNSKNENVQVGYGVMKRKELTSNVNRIDGQNPKFASYSNIYDMIRTEVPGVRVNGTSVYIVEPSSINSSNEPLIVVDGVPASSLDGIEPFMVRSIELLKGAAASIYGSRGSNGVILITLLKEAKKK